MPPMIRPMRPDDVEDAERISAAAFRALGSGWPGRTPAQQADWIRRTLHFLRYDAAGCWVVEHEDRPAGFATSHRRDQTWILATYAVLPDLQGRGLGRPLLEAALTHAAGCLRGMISSSSDPRAYRRYRAAGFTLHPQLELTGTLRPAGDPDVRHVRPGTAADRQLLDDVDRRVRDAAHGRDHDVLDQHARLLVVDHTTGQGYAWIHPETAEVALLAATNRRTAARLLGTAITLAPPGGWTLAHVTAQNEWAIDVGLAAGLDPRPSGYLAVRGMKPPVPYVHHGTFL